MKPLTPKTFMIPNEVEMQTLWMFHQWATKLSEKEWAKKVGLDGLKNVKWGIFRRELLWNIIKGLDQAFNRR